MLAALGGCDRLKSAMIVGTPSLGAQYHSDKVTTAPLPPPTSSHLLTRLESVQVYAGLVWVAPGTRYPPHGHHALEMYQVISGSAQWGPSPSHLAVRNPGEIIVHQAGQPHMMVVPEDQYLLTVYAWTGDINGR